MRHANDRGFTLVEVLVTLTLVALLAGISVPIVLSQRTAGVEAAQRADLLNVSAALENTLVSWRGTPPAPVQIASTDTTWQAIPAGFPAATTGQLSDGNTLTGTMWTDGSYCVVSTHPNGGSFTLRSDTDKIERGETCPTAALGGTGTLPTTTTLTLPNPVAGLTATAPADNTAQVTWTADFDATGYTVTAPGIAPVSTTNTSVTLTGLNPGVVQITVFAKNANGAGAGATTTVTVTGTSTVQGLQDTIAAQQAIIDDLTARIEALEAASASPTPTPAP